MKKKLLAIISIILLLSGITVIGSARHYKVFLLFSYSPEYPWEQGLLKGTRKAFKCMDVSFITFYMNTKYNTSYAYIKEVSTKAFNYIQKSNPDIIIGFDDNALRFVLKRFYRKKYRIVFGGINADPTKNYGIKPGYNMTGILERVYPIESLKLLKSIVPNAKKIFLILRNSYTSAVLYKKLLKGKKLPIKIKRKTVVSNFDEYKNAIIHAQKEADSVFIFGSTIFKDKTGYVGDKTVIPWTIRHSHIPETALLEDQVQYGALCGIVTDPERHGYTTAMMAVKVLKGTPIQKIHFKTPKIGDIAINIHRAKTLDIPIPFGLLLESKLF